MKSLKTFFLLFLSSLIIISCKKTKDDQNNPKGPDIEFYALANTNLLVKYNAKDPGTSISSIMITGLQSSETMLAIDFRPATGQLYGVGSSSRIYVINTTSGAARAIGTTAFTPALAGSVAAFDFNPTVDRIRLISTGGQNLRLNPETGTVAATDGIINIAGTNSATVTGAAYTENKAGAATTVLFDIDVQTDILYKQDPPNAGTLVSVGNLGVNLSGTGEFDIDAASNTGLAVYNNMSGKPCIFTIDLMNGKAVNVGELSGITSVSGIAIPTKPVAFAVQDGTTLLIFNPEAPEPVSKPITGVKSGEQIVGLDFRPANGQLYALGSSSTIYIINSSSGLATAVGAAFSTLITGTEFGFDFNPTVDRIRIVSNTGLNIRANPLTGEIAATDLPINPNTVAVSAAAYTNNFAGATTTVLFDIDATTDKLYKQDPPNAGTLVEVGVLGVNVQTASGFDIGGTSNNAWAILKVDGKTRIYRVNLSTGAVTVSPGTYEFTAGSITAFAIGLGF